MVDEIAISKAQGSSLTNAAVTNGSEESRGRQVIDGARGEGRAEAGDG